MSNQKIAFFWANTLLVEVKYNIKAFLEQAIF